MRWSTTFLRAAWPLLVLSAVDGCTKDTGAGGGPAGRPVVIATDPAANAIGVAADVTLTVTFDRPMAPGVGTVRLSTATPVAATLGGDGSALTIDPTRDLLAGERVTVIIGKDFVDRDGGLGLEKDYVFSFTVRPRDACAADTTPPSVTSATSVSLPAGTRRTVYDLTFDEPVAELSPATVGLTAVSGGGQAVISGIVAGFSKTTFAITVDFLEDGGTYDLTIGIGVRDLCTNALSAAATVRLSVADPCAADGQAPTMTSSLALALPSYTRRASYTLTFSEAVRDVGLDTVTLAARAGTAGGRVTDLVGDGTGTTYTVHLDGLQDGGAWDLRVGGGIADRCGNVLAQAAVAVTVQDPCGTDTTAPAVTSPTAVTLSYALTAYTYHLTFSEPVENATTGAITLTRTSGTGAGAITSLFADGADVYVDIAGFVRGDVYTLRVDPAVTDTCGHALAAPSLITLTIPDPCAGDVTPPTVASPLAAKVELGVKSYLLMFSEPVQLVQPNLTLTPLAGLGADTSFTVTALADDIYSIQARGLDWQVGDRFRLRVAIGVTDLCARPLAANVDVILDVVDCMNDFTAPTVTSPAVAILRPGTSVYRLRFSEAVTGVTAANFTVGGGATLSAVTALDTANYDVTLAGLVDTNNYTLLVTGAVADLCGLSLVPFTIDVTAAQVAPPANSEGVLDLNTLGATVAHLTWLLTTPPAPVDDTPVACGVSGAELALQYTVQWGGAVAVSTFGSSFDTVLQVFDADGTTLLGCNDDAGVPQSEVFVPGCFVPGDVLFMTVDRDGGGWIAGSNLEVNAYETGPALLVNPADNATGVSRTAMLSATFGTPLATTVGTVTLSGDQGYTAVYTIGVSPQIALASNNTVLEVTPAAAFGQGEVITVTLSGLEDGCGVTFNDTWSFTAASGAGHLVINEVDPGISDWVEIFNGTGSAVNMTGMRLIFDPGGTSSIYTFPSFTLVAGAAVEVHESSSGGTAPILLYMGFNVAWNPNQDGYVALLDSVGSGVDFVRFGGSTATPPAGTAWIAPNPPNPAAAGQTLARDMLGTDTDKGSDWENTCGVDSSVPTPGAVNGTAPSLTLISPNGGEAWYQGRNRNITWTSSNVGNVDLRYSTNGGASWTPIATNVANTGSYGWSVPLVTSVQCLVEVRATAGGLSDQSDGLFSIAVPPPACLYDFDTATLQGWTVSNVHPTVGWHVDAQRSSSPSYSLYYGSPSTHTYDSGARNYGSATSPAVQVAAANPQLTFMIWNLSEANWDWVRLQVDNGSGFVVVWSADTDLELADGTSGGSFIPIEVDLSAYAGDAVQLRFYFDTSDEFNNAFEGTYIDEISVDGSCL